MDSYIIIIICLLLSAFFSGIEIAFVTSNKFRIELENKQGHLHARIFSYFMRYPSRFLGTMLVGNNIALVVYGMVMASILDPLIRPHAHNEITTLLVQTLFSTVIILITAEFLPKVLFRINPHGMLNLFAIPVYIFYYILYPIAFLVTGMSELILRKLFQVEFSSEKITFGRIDLDNYLKEVTSSQKDNEPLDHEIKIFQNALSFKDIKVRECMVPRTEIIAMEVNEEIDVLRTKFIETGLSKILIYKESIDNIIGYTHSFELFKHPADIKSILLPISIVPESMPVNVLLSTFTQQHKSVAIVVDEFGGTAGMITIEDVVEEIFGEIEDEHDVEELTEKRITENEFLFSCRLEIDYINSEYHLDLPILEDYETLGGMIIHYHESIPVMSEEIIIDKFIFTIREVSETRVELVHLKIQE